mgnify:CR=1 FL=1
MIGRQNLLGSGGFYSQKYQDLSFYQSPFSQYFNNLNTGRRGYIYNSTPGGATDETMPAGQQNPFWLVHHTILFGLRNGKSAMNKYINKYIFNEEVL